MKNTFKFGTVVDRAFFTRREKELRVVINVLTKVKQQKDNKCAHF